MHNKCNHDWEIIGHYVHPCNWVRKCSECLLVEIRTYEKDGDKFDWISLADVDLKGSTRPEDCVLTYADMNELKQLQHQLNLKNDN